MMWFTPAMAWVIHWLGMPFENSRYRRNSKYRLGSNGRVRWPSSQAFQSVSCSRISLTAAMGRQRGPLKLPSCETRLILPSLPDCTKARAAW